MMSSIISAKGRRDALLDCIVDIPSSPIPDLLRNNQPPSASEMMLARIAIADINPDLQRLEEETAKLRDVIDELERCRDALRSYRHAHEGTLSAIRRIPPETLGRILVESLPDFPEALSNYAYEEGVMCSGGPYRDAVSNLGLVCRYWREVSVLTPQLWSRICLDGFRSIDTDQVDRWLQRSGDTPLSVVCPDISNIIPSLSANAPRWESANLRSDQRHWGNFTASTHHFSLLRTISVNVVDFFADDPDSAQEEDWSIQINAPLLRHFALRILHPEAQMPSIEISFSQLSSLNLDITSPITHRTIRQRILAMLEHAPNLLDCSLSFGGIEDDSGPNPAQTQSLIHFPNLRCLTVDGEGPIDVLQHLVTPALREFKCTSGFQRCPFNSFTSLITRSRCTIEALEVTLMNYTFVDDTTGEELIQLFRSVPDLVSLEIMDYTNSFMSEPVLRAFNRNSSKAYLSPLLKQLRLNIPTSFPEIELVVDMIASRFEPVIMEESLGAGSSILETVTLVHHRWTDTPTESDYSARARRAGQRLALMKENGHKIAGVSSPYEEDISLEEVFLGLPQSQDDD